MLQEIKDLAKKMEVDLAQLQLMRLGKIKDSEFSLIIENGKYVIYREDEPIVVENRIKDAWEQFQRLTNKITI